jgi:hypothetical protein
MIDAALQLFADSFGDADRCPVLGMDEADDAFFAVALGRKQDDPRSRVSVAKSSERARGAADRLVRELVALPLARRQAAIDSRLELRTWAVVERLAHESEREAANDPWQALEWAELGVRAAGLIPDKREHKRLLGYAWAFVANARRVTSDLRGADQAFTLAWKHWKAGRSSEVWVPLAEWYLFDLEASLRRDQRICQRALALHKRALAVADAEERGVVLLNMAKTLETTGSLALAIDRLREAEPFIDADRKPRLRFAYCLNLAGYLALSCRPDEAELQMPEARSLAIRQRNGVDLIRTLWVQSWIDLAAGRRREAIAGLDQVRKDFCARRLAYDAALATLELAVLLLEDGAYARVRELAVEIYWVFASRQIRQEALASLQLFCDAVKRDEATAALARRVLAEVREAGRAPASPD